MCSNFEDIFDARHFIDSLRDEVRIVKRLPKRFTSRYGYQSLEMPPISWSNDKYYLQNRSCRFSKLRCRVNYLALKFTPQIEALGFQLVHALQGRGPFVALHQFEHNMRCAWLVFGIIGVSI
ncbi:unnamed protein product [Ilex paraguariensis]|uniref:O-fucosyltransferase family protein n=1 Tax=Ilex paraguariensis TaxID=185542 RepID=A0ABC8R7T5_9AQUA